MPHSIPRMVDLPCPMCGKVRSVRYKKGRLNKVCPSCANKIPSHWLPKERYEVGDIRTGKLIGKTDGHTYILAQCIDCGKREWVSIQTVKNPRRCRPCIARLNYFSNPHMHLIRRWEQHPFWKGGKTSRRDGYIGIRLPKDNPFYPMIGSSGYVLEHRLIMAQHLKRLLYPWEIVHHKNGLKYDNRIENLELCTKGGHMVSHGKGYQDGYIKGYRDGKGKRLSELEQRVTLLEAENTAIHKQLENDNQQTEDLNARDVPSLL